MAPLSRSDQTRAWTSAAANPRWRRRAWVEWKSLDNFPAMKAWHLTIIGRKAITLVRNGPFGCGGFQKRDGTIQLHRSRYGAPIQRGQTGPISQVCIFARGPEALAAAKSATSSIPIVAVDFESDPVVMGFVKNLARPGGNITGVFLDLPELSGKQLELIKEVVSQDCSHSNPG